MDASPPVLQTPDYVFPLTPLDEPLEPCPICEQLWIVSSATIVVQCPRETRQEYWLTNWFSNELPTGRSMALTLSDIVASAMASFETVSRVSPSSVTMVGRTPWNIFGPGFGASGIVACFISKSRLASGVFATRFEHLENTLWDSTMCSTESRLRILSVDSRHDVCL